MATIRLDGDAAFLFEFHEVHGGAHAVLTLDIVDGMNALGIEQDAFGEGGLARIDMSADSDIAQCGLIAVKHDFFSKAPFKDNRVTRNRASKQQTGKRKQVGGQAVLGRQDASPTPWLTERHGYDPTC